MRILSSLVLLFALPAVTAAQTSFRLIDPVLTVDGARVVATGAPLSQQSFGVLTVGVPGYGTYTVSERPFAGARRAGQFDGRGLYFAVQGHSLRLLSREPILSLSGPISAYVKHEPSRSRRARGLAHLSIADDPSGRGRRSIAPAPAAATPSGPSLAAAAASFPELTDRPAARYLRDAEVSRLRDELDRLVTDRGRLATERDRLMAERDDARSSRQARAEAVRAVVSDRPVQLVALEAERNRLASEGRRLAVERDQLSQAYDRVVAERDALADDFADLRRRAEDAEARADGTTSADLARLRTEVDDLRAALVQRDASLELLEAARDDRGGRLPAVQAELARTRELLTDALAERDDARAERDGAVRARDAATAQADRLRADLDRLEQEVAALRADGGSDADRRVLLDRLEAAERARDEIARERDALADEVLRLRADLASQAVPQPVRPEPVRSEPVRAAPEPIRPEPIRPEPVTEPLRVDRPSGPIAYLPGFDFGRLANPDDLQRRLDAVVYPARASRSNIEGDVLVLFETDTSGHVVRSAVPAPVGGGLDALAEDLVRAMRFEPPRIDGEAAPLRSQVLVRFEL